VSPVADTFLDRVLSRARTDVRDYVFQHWAVPGKPTEEALGLLPVPGVDAERFLARVMDIANYRGPIAHVEETRVIPDPAYVPPAKVRFYHRVKIPLLGDLHQESVLERLGNRGGFEVAAWRQLDDATLALSPKVAIRTQYNEGVWMVAPGLVGYALSSAPRREDVGLLKWKALTTGGDVAASKVIRENIAGMARWAARG
jgi:hypothetical protein